MMSRSFKSISDTVSCTDLWYDKQETSDANKKSQNIRITDERSEISLLRVDYNMWDLLSQSVGALHILYYNVEVINLNGNKGVSCQQDRHLAGISK